MLDVWNFVNGEKKKKGKKNGTEGDCAAANSGGKKIGTEWNPEQKAVTT